MDKVTRKTNTGVGLGLLAILLFAGCATSAPRAKYTQELGARVGSADATAIEIVAAPGVSMVDYEKSRLAQRVEEKLAEKKVLNAAGARKDFAVEVYVTRYDKGSAFARSMLAGLGQIHVDGTVRLFELPERKKVGEFLIKKTFAWGGIYGASTSIEDVEFGFAEGVAAALTGQEEKPAKKTAATGGGGAAAGGI